MSLGNFHYKKTYTLLDKLLNMYSCSHPCSYLHKNLHNFRRIHGHTVPNRFLCNHVRNQYNSFHHRFLDSVLHNFGHTYYCT